MGCFHLPWPLPCPFPADGSLLHRLQQLKLNPRKPQGSRKSEELLLRGDSARLCREQARHCCQPQPRGAVQHPLECWLQLSAMCWCRKQISNAADEGKATLQFKKKKKKSILGSSHE